MNRVWYFHGGAPGLNVGDQILPPSVTGVTPNGRNGAMFPLDESRAGHLRPDRVYFTTMPHIAMKFAANYPPQRRTTATTCAACAWFCEIGRLCPGGDLYAVEPLRPIEIDPDWPRPESPVCGLATSARVVAVVLTALSVCEWYDTYADYGLTDCRCPACEFKRSPIPS